MKKIFAEHIQEMFDVPDETLRAGMRDFMNDMERGLVDSKISTLYMEPCYVALPTGKERGRAVALDFGGTNARASLVELTDDGLLMRKQVAKPLRKAGAYDVTTSTTTRDELFDFLAALVVDVLDGNGTEQTLPLGHTFSYGTHQEDLHDARLIVWSKEIAVPGVEGELVNALLADALRRKHVNVQPTAILNDTVAVLLAAAFAHPGTAIGTIYATGFNSCYLETFGGNRLPMVYNIESGSFGHFPQNDYDKALDAASAKPGAQRLEKMISGRYLGELMSRIVRDGDAFEALPTFTGEDVSRFATEGTETESIVANALIRRSAKLAAMTLAAVLRHRANVDGQERVPAQPLAIDGSVFEHMPGVAAEMRKTLSMLLSSEEAAGLTFTLEKDASGTGAAIAAVLGTD
ncbi:hexokinase [uncultured Selenomonas sp.]|uniref:hexokinase n=1 Tax=uncultured Selenomonas sp. TaxID=159275 RepID=UPI0025D8471D|nr:hexokinase [uncultured Selenomonas sp.]